MALLLLVAALAGRAEAHATLERAEPAPNSLVLKRLSGLSLVFSEPVDPTRIRIQVLDRRARRVDRYVEVSPDRRSAAVQVEAREVGVYTVAWRVISQVDGHPSQGAYTVTVGALAPGAFAELAGAERRLPPVPLALRWLTLLASLALAGCAMTWRLVIVPALQETGAPDASALSERVRAALTKVGIAGAVAAATGNAAEMALLIRQAADLAGGTAMGAVLADALGSPPGRLIATRVVLAITVAALLRRGGWPPLIAAAFLLLTHSLASHAGARGGAAVAADWLHLAAAAAWVGGLAVVAFALPPAWRGADPGVRARLWGTLVARFSRTAAASVALLVATGVYAAMQHVPAVRELRDTLYGLTLIAKIALLLPVLALAAVNRFLLRPRLEQAARAPADPEAAARTRRTFLRTVRAESALSLAVVLAAAALTILPPARNAATLPYQY
ncbi:MAG: copper resistance protein CopC, partial [Armatimonadetes bacterium]|nr:copper resistance protein CopC [Armatimonadota bacterium]